MRGWRPAGPGRWPRVALMVACEAVPLTAARGHEHVPQANPSFVMANGGLSVVTALLIEPAGTFVPDGTVVFFFTNLGPDRREQGKTVNGVARVNFVADSRSGTATVTAYSGGPAPAPSAQPRARAPPRAPRRRPQRRRSRAAATPASSISIGSALPAHGPRDREPAARSPARARPRSPPTSSTPVGNPVQNVPVIFSVESSGRRRSQETLDERRRAAVHGLQRPGVRHAHARGRRSATARRR